MNRQTTDIHDKEVGDYFDQAATTFDTFYDHKRSALMQWVDRKFRSDMFERYRLTFEALTPMDGATVLDVGCGSGPYLAEALRSGASRVVGLDMAPGMLDLARQRVTAAGGGDRCDFVAGTYPDAAPNEKFDFALVMGVMDYVPDPLTFLTALAGQVRRRAVLSFPSTHWFRTPLRKARYFIKRCPVYFYRRDQIESQMTGAGFQNVAVTEIKGAGMDFVATGERRSA